MGNILLRYRGSTFGRAHTAEIRGLQCESDIPALTPESYHTAELIYTCLKCAIAACKQIGSTHLNYVIRFYTGSLDTSAHSGAKIGIADIQLSAIQQFDGAADSSRQPQVV